MSENSTNKISSEPVAIVTGASQGLGRAIALGLAEAGYAVALLARSREKLNVLAHEISDKFNRRTWELPVDVSNCDQVMASIHSLIEAEGRIDVLVNNAGIVKAGGTELAVEDFEKQVAVNLTGAFYCVKAVVDIMKKHGAGHIINIASTSGKFAKSTRLGYGASKYGMLGMSEALYHELARDNIKVTALCPRYMPTVLTEKAKISNEDKIQLSDMVKTILYLLSLSASASIKDIVIDNTVIAAEN